MKRRDVVPLAALLALASLAGCDDEQAAAAPPPPAALTGDAVGHFCGMTLVEHAGPKGQALLRGEAQPVWFSSARDTIAYTRLAESPRNIAALYVSDMAKAESWDDPGATNWVDAHRAFFVLGSDRRGGMGAEEAVPFSERSAAERFAAEHGGRVLTFDEVPRDWALGGEAAGAAAAAERGPGERAAEHPPPHSH
ncbi:copper resistance protein CopZ [Falsiroseomonas bella]|uniref:Copper resistance protein CopZ n=1 Tax=Falsiroseomonas bella TaxID=2184016 RepID=A0A317FDA1_9PROT|nr:nitrous oxide reductase accessory protein NosL [Falsiroseomonas bella]PWS35909.1 copper resistance protein CopZ [Falsiroseomonas bella]